MKNLALSLLIAGSLVMPVAFAADAEMKSDAAQTTETKTTEAMEHGDGHAKKHRKHHRAKRHHGGKHHGKHHKRHHKHHRTSARCGGGGCGTGQCN